jgi:hypothetical protein
MRSARMAIVGAVAALAIAAAGGAALAEDDFDAIAKEAIGKALGPARAAPRLTKIAEDEGVPLKPLADNKTPAPLPSTAKEVEYDAEEGVIEFMSSSSVKQLADFYRSAMAALGWSAEPTPINSDTMVAVDFVKGQDRLSFTLVRMGGETQVTAHGDALAAKGAAAPSDQPAASSGDKAPAAGAAEPELTVEETGGLPVPTPHSLSGSESSLFRSSADARTSASLAAVLAFYRRELAKRGWTEHAEKAAVKADAAELAYDSPGGPATLKLGRDGDETTVLLSVRDKAAAMKSPLWPKPGQVKLAFGNMRDKAAEVTVGGKKVKVAAGAGKNGPDGPTVDLAPGKYDLALKSGGHETIDAGPEEIWIVMVGPGGLLAVQGY